MTAFARLPTYLLAVGSMSSAAVAKEGAASGKRRFLARAQSEGEQCGSSGSDGHFYGDCSSGLDCVAPAAGSPDGAPSTCQKALLPCQEAPVTSNCGNPSLKCFYDPTCSTSGGVGCNAGGAGLDCRFCDTGGGAPPCPTTGQGEGEQCGSSGSDGHFYGNCSPGLACVPPADGAPLVGAPSVCHKVCGSFGADGDHVNCTCSAGQTCSGKAATPCREWAGECYMYCDSADRRLAQGVGGQCGSSGSDGHFYGDCSSGLDCVAPAAGSPDGTPSTCQKALLPCQEAPVTCNCGNPSLKCFYDPTCSTSGGVGCNAGGVGLDCRFCDTGGGAPPCPTTGQGEGGQCGSSGSDGHFYGDCSPGLACVPPADGAPLVGAPSVCHKVCGSFGADGDHVNGTCSAGQTCSGKAATPCREWAGECYMYCS